jgi:hypothetical protein
MAREKDPREESPFQSTEKIMQTFRISRELVTFLKGEAAAKELDLTACVNRMLEGLRTWFGLPEAASRLLEADREATKMGRFEYLLHVLYERSLELREKGPGFDAPGAEHKCKKRQVPAHVEPILTSVSFGYGRGAARCWPSRGGERVGGGGRLSLYRGHRECGADRAEAQVERGYDQHVQRVEVTSPQRITTAIGSRSRSRADHPRARAARDRAPWRAWS